MSDVFWRRCKPDSDGVVWNDLRDHKVKKDWVITYREAGTKWLVMHLRSSHGEDRYIDKADISEEQLRNEIRLHYILTRGET
jgi:hypothetical protein